MYNLTVANTHTYYVLAGYIPVLVHNTDPDERPWWDVDSGDDAYGEYDSEYYTTTEEAMLRGDNRASKEKLEAEMRRGGLDPNNRVDREKVHRELEARKLDGNPNVGLDGLRETIEDVGGAC